MGSEVHHGPESPGALADELLAVLDPLPFPRRMRELAGRARAASAEGRLGALIEELERRGTYERRLAAVAAAAYRALTAVGALARPPQAGRHLYADLDELRGVLAARGITDSVELERELVRRIGPSVAGGHRFGDAPHTLRLRLATLPLLGAAEESRLQALQAPDPLELPHVAAALAAFETAFRGLLEDGPAA